MNRRELSDPYLTDPVDTHVRREIGARRAVLHLARHGEEELKVLCDAVELTDIFICRRRGGGGNESHDSFHIKMNDSIYKKETSTLT